MTVDYISLEVLESGVSVLKLKDSYTRMGLSLFSLILVRVSKYNTIIWRGVTEKTLTLVLDRV